MSYRRHTYRHNKNHFSAFCQILASFLHLCDYSDFIKKGDLNDLELSRTKYLTSVFRKVVQVEKIHYGYKQKSPNNFRTIPVVYKCFFEDRKWKSGKMT